MTTVSIHATLAALLHRMDNPELAENNIIQWGAPVACFGDLARATVASVGLNPSNREFVDERGNELKGSNRRFHTLDSLGLDDWGQVEAWHVEMIIGSFSSYFSTNPYDRWFKRLDQVISGTGASFYSALYPACHLDLVPYATECKWTDLSPTSRKALLEGCADALGLLLRDSQVQTLVLNGQTVVNQFQQVSKVELRSTQMRGWSLPRESGRDVGGIAYFGLIDHISSVDLNRTITVLGYNHNLQSSFGVTSEVISAIRKWVAAAVLQNAL